MREIVKVAAAAIGLLLASCAPAFADWSVEAMNDQIDQTNFMVNSGCSGTLIDLESRLILTANHCISAQYITVEREEVNSKGEVTKKQVRVLQPGTVSQYLFEGTLSTQTTTYRTQVVGFDKGRDLALLAIVAESIPNTMVSKLACDDAVRGETVYTVGNPLGVLYSSVTQGIVSSITRSYETLLMVSQAEGNRERALMQISGGVVGGNSGGSVYDSDGFLIGVPVLASPMNEVIGLAVPLPEIREFLKSKIKTKKDYKDAYKRIFAHCEEVIEAPAYVPAIEPVVEDRE
jgi:S1-C subfamily serine protease